MCESSTIFSGRDEHQLDHGVTASSAHRAGARRSRAAAPRGVAHLRYACVVCALTSASRCSPGRDEHQLVRGAARGPAPRASSRAALIATGAGAPTINTRIRTRGGCSYNKYANSHPWRLLLPREGVGCLPLTSPAHHPQRHPIPGRVAPAVLLHTRSYCFLLLDHSLHGNRFNLTPLLYSQMKATRESTEAIDFATVSRLRLWPLKPSKRLFP